MLGRTEPGGEWRRPQVGAPPRAREGRVGVPCWGGQSRVGSGGSPRWAPLLALGVGELSQQLACRPQPRPQSGGPQRAHCLLTGLTSKCADPGTVARRGAHPGTQEERRVQAWGRAQRGAQRTRRTSLVHGGPGARARGGPHLPEPREAAAGPPQTQVS